MVLWGPVLCKLPKSWKTSCNSLPLQLNVICFTKGFDWFVVVPYGSCRDLFCIVSLLLQSNNALDTSNRPCRVFGSILDKEYCLGFWSSSNATFQVQRIKKGLYFSPVLSASLRTINRINKNLDWPSQGSRVRTPVLFETCGGFGIQKMVL